MSKMQVVEVSVPSLRLDSKIALKDEAWKKKREQSTAGLMRKRNADDAILVKHVDTLLVKLEHERRNSSEPIDIRIMLRLHALKISLAMLSVIDDLAEDDEASAAFDKAFNYCTAYLYTRVALGNFYWLADSFAFHKACRECHALIDKAVLPIWTREEELRKLGMVKSGDDEHGETLLEDLVKSHDSYDELALVVSGLIFASYETTGALLGWTFDFLARHPVSYRILRESIIEELRTVEKALQDLNAQTLMGCTYTA